MIRLRGRLAGALALLALLATPALPTTGAGHTALAHAQLVASSPAAGSVLAESPAELRLIFSEPLEAGLTSLDVFAQDGTRVLERAGSVDAADDHALVVADPQLPEGVYSLTWRSLSAADGHTAEGFFTFGVGDVSPEDAGGFSGATHDAADPVAVVGRWLTYLGLMLALGVALFHRVVIRDGAMPRQLARWLAGGLGVSAAATLALAVIGGLEAGGLAEYLVASRNGGLQLARAGVAAAGAAALLLVPARLAGVVAAAAGLSGIVLLVLAGHASAFGVVPMLAAIAHVAAAATWIGGLAALVALQLRPRAVVHGAAPPMRRLIPRFSALALTAIGLVALTGVYADWVQTGALVTTTTDYGRTLIAKTALAVAAFSLGGLNYFDGGRLRGWLGGFRTRLAAEAGAAIAILLVTGLLSSTSADETGGAEIAAIPDAFGAVAPDMSMTVAPGRPGVNRVVVTTTDAMAQTSGSLELALDRLDLGTTTRVPLIGEGMAGMAGMEGMDHSALMTADGDGTVDWIADAIVLPPDSRWDASVLVLSGTGAELSRQRFAFGMSDDGVAEGTAESLLTPGIGVAALLLVGGGLGLGLGLGGMSLPRCEAFASRVALLGGGAAAVVLGGLIGFSQVAG